MIAHLKMRSNLMLPVVMRRARLILTAAIINAVIIRMRRRMIMVLHVILLILKTTLWVGCFWLCSERMLRILRRSLILILMIFVAIFTTQCS
jgi:hypothetical protein